MPPFMVARGQFIVALVMLTTSVPLGGQSPPSSELGDLRQITAGTFLQGSPASEAHRAEHEGPVRRIEIAPFSIGVFEVTVGEFRAFVEATGYLTDAERDTPVGDNPAPGCFSHRIPTEPSAGWVSGRSWRDPGYAQDDGHPVVCVSWRDARAYVAWIAGLTGRSFRLPSESEFEYARRAGTSSPWGWPDQASPCETANLADRSLGDLLPGWLENADCDDGYSFTSPAGSYPPNALGIYDLEGNVSEWTQDCWHDGYHGAPSTGRAWESESDEGCGGRVLRGGDFVGRLDQLRSAHRSYIPPEFRAYHAGFRVAVGPGGP